MAGDRFDDPRLTAMGLLVEVYEGVTARVGRVHRHQGLSGTDFDTLIRLARSPGRQLRMSDLAAQTALSTSGITRIIDRLERQGLVRRETCPGDRRSHLAVLTETGTQRLVAHVPDVINAVELWFTGTLPPDQLQSLLTALHTVRAATRPDAAAGTTTG